MLTIGEFARIGQVSPRTLRHYDELGLLVPQHVDPINSYRLYSVRQMVSLHQILALRDLGFSLDRIGDLLRDEPDLEQLHAMLKQRTEEIEQTVTDERARLARARAHLHSIERRKDMSSQNIIVKQSERLRVAEAWGIAKELSPEYVPEVSKAVVPRILEHLAQQNVTPGMCVEHYEEPYADGSVKAYVGFEIGDQPAASGDGVDIVELEPTQVASTIHRGAMATIGDTYETLLQWIEDSEFRMTEFSRELYRQWDEQNMDNTITEIQVPIAPK